MKERYGHLNEIFNEHIGGVRVVKSEELCRRLHISLRQLRSDINYFKNTLRAPLAFDRRRNGWYYETPFIFIDRLALSRDELHQLDLAIKMLTQEEGLAQRFGQLTAVAEKVRTASRKAGPSKKPEKVVFFAPQPDYLGAKYLPFFIEAIERDFKTAFDYRAYHEPEARRVIFDPFFIKQWDGRWYVGGQSHDPTELDFIRVYPLERIVGQPVQDGYCHNKPKGFSPEKYWENIYGITDPRENKTVETIRLRFSKFYKNYFLDAPFFEPFVATEEGAGTLLVEMRLKINWELRRKLASFGKDVTVLGPPRLVDDMRTFLSGALENYSD